jgi:hypothetical protein
MGERETKTKIDVASWGEKQALCQILRNEYIL